MQEKVENKCIKTLDLKLGSGINILSQEIISRDL